jgi:hypothetical protein
LCNIIDAALTHRRAKDIEECDKKDPDCLAVKRKKREYEIIRDLRDRAMNGDKQAKEDWKRRTGKSALPEYFRVVGSRHTSAFGEPTRSFATSSGANQVYPNRDITMREEYAQVNDAIAGYRLLRSQQAQLTITALELTASWINRCSGQPLPGDTRSIGMYGGDTIAGRVIQPSDLPSSSGSCATPEQWQQHREEFTQRYPNAARNLAHLSDDEFFDASNWALADEARLSSLALFRSV